MGKASKWFRGILGFKKEKEQSNSGVEISNLTASSQKRRWSFGRVGKDQIALDGGFEECSWRREEQSRRAIAVAAATAAVADAAVAAAQAAVAVVRLTSGGGGGKMGGGGCVFWGKWEVLGAVRIQSAFRGYLARKALRALRGLVKLQALVRGFLVRKRASAALASMEALVRAQLAVKLHRSRRSLDKENRFLPRKSTEKRLDDSKVEFHSKRISTSYETIHNLFSETPKIIVEVDTWNKPKSRSRRVNDYYIDQPNSSPLPYHVPSSITIPENRFRDSDWSFVGEEIKFSTAHNTPRLRSAGRTNLNSPKTPARSACGEGYFRDYENSPSYMHSTKSYMAKLRSNSAPKQRPEAASGPRKMTSLSDIMAARKSVSTVKMHRPV